MPGSAALVAVHPDAHAAQSIDTFFCNLIGNAYGRQTCEEKRGLSVKKRSAPTIPPQTQRNSGPARITAPQPMRADRPSRLPLKKNSGGPINVASSAGVNRRRQALAIAYAEPAQCAVEEAIVSVIVALVILLFCRASI
jgi:hypothetical protein